MASGVNYLLVSGITPKGRLGRRLMMHRARIQRRYRQRELAMREGMLIRRDRIRARGVSRGIRDGAPAPSSPGKETTCTERKLRMAWYFSWERYGQVEVNRTTLLPPSPPPFLFVAYS